MCSTWGMLPNQHQLTLTENDPWMEFSSWASSLSPGPLLPYPVWSGVSLDSPLLPTLLRIRFLLPNSLSSPAYSVSNYFALSCVISIWITLLYDFNLDYATSFFTCAYLCVFSKHVILLKYVLKLARNCHQHFTEYGYKLRLSKHKETKHQKPLEKILIEDIQKSGKLSHPTN